MPGTGKVLWIAPVALSVALLTAPLVSAGPQPTNTPEATKPRASMDATVTYVDDSNMKLKLLDEKLEMTTKYGVVFVPVASIQRIEFASRVPADIAEKAMLAIAKLNNSEFKVREAATEELKELRERAYPFVLKAQKNEDPEIARRAAEIVTHIRNKVPAAQLEAREFDIVQTDDSKITGRFTAETLRVGTFQFGEQQLKLADLRALRTFAAATAEEAAAPQAPVTLSAYQNQFGKELTFAVTGFTPMAGANANLWGSDVYTVDSNLAAAVVHAGLAKPGETVVIRVRIIHSPQQYVATFRNNVSSTAYGSYPPGAFEFLRK